MDQKKGWSGSNSMRDIQKTSAGGQNCLPSRELTYPTFGKGKSSSKVPWELTYGQRMSKGALWDPSTQPGWLPPRETAEASCSSNFFKPNLVKNVPRDVVI